MQMNRELAKKLGTEKFVELHTMQGHDMIDVLFELQMAKAWDDSGRQVYEFDQDFADSIVNEKWSDLLPDCIGNRPHDCFYMKLSCGKNNEGTVVYVVPTDKIDGFDINYFPGADSGKGVYYGGAFGYDMRCIVNTGSEMFALCAFAISKTFELMLDDTTITHYPVSLVANGVAYLCSANADIIPSYTPQKNLKRNNAKRRSTASWYEVGYRIGSELRAYRRSTSRTLGGGGWTVRPHMRRAHWHHYWVGPRDGERKLVLKWLAPTMVGVGKIGAATVHHVS